MEAEPPKNVAAPGEEHWSHTLQSRSLFEDAREILYERFGVDVSAR